MGRLVSESTASGGTVEYTYNELNVKKQLTNARGQERKFFYDAMGRITGCITPEDSVSYTYDQNGNVLTVTDKNGVIYREYDALNRVTKYTDTYGNTIRYEYDEVGNLTRLVYPDHTAVQYTYDENRNLLTVTDWASRVTSYTYDENNRVVGEVKSNGCVVTTVYDNKQRVISHVEKTPSGTVISGFEYTYDAMSRIVEEKVLDKNTKLCYTYDTLHRVTKRTSFDTVSGMLLFEHTYAYDAAGNLLNEDTNGSASFTYDLNNRLTSYSGVPITYDADGNMLSAPLYSNSSATMNLEYDSANRLIKAGGNEYTYNAEDVRIRNDDGNFDTKYTYNTNCPLSQLLYKTNNGVVAKYVYGHGLIGEDKHGWFKTFHFDSRGSTVAITNECAVITDRFIYDTYGNMLDHEGNNFFIFGYNGRDGVITDSNGLCYMRARYYAPKLRRFVNADIIPGQLSEAVTLNRYAYANGNPVSNVDPFGLEAERGNSIIYNGNTYAIFTPTYTDSDNLTGWNEVASLNYELSKTVFRWDKFVVNMVGGPDDMAGIANGENKYVSQNISGYVALYSLLANTLSAYGNSIEDNSMHITFTFQEYEGNRRVIITMGTAQQANTMQSYAGKTFFATSSGIHMGHVAWISEQIKVLYEEITGKKAEYFPIYDIMISFDEKHKYSNDFYYLWINENSELMTSRIVYENDKIQIGKGFFYFKPLVSLPINGASRVSSDYENIFYEAISENSLKIQ